MRIWAARGIRAADTGPEIRGFGTVNLRPAKKETSRV